MVFLFLLAAAWLFTDPDTATGALVRAGTWLLVTVLLILMAVRQ